MKLAPLFLLASALASVTFGQTLVIVGASGEDRFDKRFADAAEAWTEASESAERDYLVVGRDESDTQDSERIRLWIEEIPERGDDAVWIVYLGHGTYDRSQALLNLRGPDLDAETLNRWLEPVSRELVFIHGGSASAPFLVTLSRPGRILVSATRSGDEINYARFGERFANAISNLGADIDQDGQVSVLEAFLEASDEVQRFYKESGRLASEHALIDDNGDGSGTPADWFEAGRLVKSAAGDALPDGERARQIAYIRSAEEEALSPSQRERRDELERSVEALRRRKSSMVEGEYYRDLEALLLQIAEIYREPPGS